MASQDGSAAEMNKRLTKEFLETEGYRYHEIFDVSAQSPDPLPATRYLEEVIRDYNATADEDKRFNIKSCTFNDVIEELDEVQAKEKTRTKNFTNLLGQYSDSISPWLEMIPSDHGLSFLSAGLKIIFKIAKDNFDNRAKILQAFEDIPYVILQTKIQQSQFSSVPILRSEAVALYTTLVKALAELIELLQRRKSGSSLGHNLKDGLKRVGQKLQPAARAERIDEILGGVIKSTNHFKDCLENVKTQVTIDIDGKTNAVLKNTSEIRKTELEIQAVMAGMSRDFRNMQQYHSHAYQQIIAYFEPFFFDIYSRVENASRMTNSDSLARPRGFLSIVDLYNCLQVSPTSTGDDVDTLLKGANKLDLQAQIQAQQLFTSMEFARWKSSTHAETLFVQGNLPVVGSQRITAMSAVGATLYLTISKNTDAIVLFFPCGLHEGAMDPISGPNGLIRSLIAQILLQRNTISLDFIDNRPFAEAIQSPSLSALLALLVALIERLPQTVKVVMILDGLVRFESRAWRRDLSDIIQTLNSLLCNKYLRPVVKLLVTSPYANPGKVEKTLSPCQVLRLRRTGARHGHRLSEMNRYLDDSMREPGQDASEIDSSSSDSNDLEEMEDTTDDDTESDEDEDYDESDD